MHNWYISIFEATGIISHETALKLVDIKNHIHREVYDENLEELKKVLGDTSAFQSIENLSARLSILEEENKDLKSKIYEIEKDKLNKKLASKKKA